MPILRARMWLAPFDQGLSQEFELHAIAEVGARFFALEAVMRTVLRRSLSLAAVEQAAAESAAKTVSGVAISDARHPIANISRWTGRREAY